VGSGLAPAGLRVVAGREADWHGGPQFGYIVMAGAGMGFMLGQASSEAENRAYRYSYGEATGITQTVRSYGASLGFAILGALLLLLSGFTGEPFSHTPYNTTLASLVR